MKLSLTTLLFSSVLSAVLGAQASPAPKVVYSPRCVFKDGTKLWGLKDDDSWGYLPEGSNPYSSIYGVKHLHVLDDPVDVIDDIVRSCYNAKRYYKVSSSLQNVYADSYHYIIANDKGLNLINNREFGNPPYKDNSYFSCYFGNGGWQWALNSDNSYFWVQGMWYDFPKTSITQFYSNLSSGVESIYQACLNAKRYYNMEGDVSKIFAATSTVGSNYLAFEKGVEINTSLDYCKQNRWKRSLQENDIDQCFKESHIFQRFENVDDRLARSSAPYYDGEDSDQRMDEDAVRELGYRRINAVLSFNSISLTQQEIERLRRNGIAYLHLRLEDYTAPTQDQLDQGVEFVNSHGHYLYGRVLVYCGYGHGRTGTFVTAWQISPDGGNKLGEDQEATISRMKTNHVEEPEQRVAIFDFIRRNTPTPSPTKAPTKAPTSDGGSCMSGNTGVKRLTENITIQDDGIDELDQKRNDESIYLNEEVVLVKDLNVGDTIVGIDKNHSVSSCNVEAVGSFGNGPMYGNYTEGHFIYDSASNNITMHGASGILEEGARYDVLTSCPLGIDESGTAFTPIDSDFCGINESDMKWEDYVALHSAILAIVRESGGFWFSKDVYSDPKSMLEYAPVVCETMLKCARPEHDCEDFERAGTTFIDTFLTGEAKDKARTAFPALGRMNEKGSPSQTIILSDARNTTHRPHMTVIMILLSCCVVLVALVVLSVSTYGKKRSNYKDSNSFSIKKDHGDLP